MPDSEGHEKRYSRVRGMVKNWSMLVCQNTSLREFRAKGGEHAVS